MKSKDVETLNKLTQDIGATRSRAMKIAASFAVLEEASQMLNEHWQELPEQFQSLVLDACHAGLLFGRFNLAVESKDNSILNAKRILSDELPALIRLSTHITSPKDYNYVELTNFRDKLRSACDALRAEMDKAEYFCNNT